MTPERASGPAEAQPAGPRYLLLGEILRPHGVRGELRMRILTDFPERIPGLAAVYVGVGPAAPDVKPYSVEHMRMHQAYGLLKLRGVDDRDQAELLRDLLVMVPLENAVPLEPGEFYLYQLIGLAVETADGTALGTLRDVIETGANDVYVVASPAHGEVLLPAIDEVIVRIDIAAGVMVVNLIEGLLP
ncbi:MAG: ribosome maturation factor RimM [Chloroflexota bacterium]|nr:MAG: ribosome maturation factor RimM [Chloroflexota bacterium]